MNSELIIHLVIDLVITFIILYYIKKHIRETEVFYDESRVEWKRREEHDKLLVQKLNAYLSEVALDNKRKFSYIEKKDENSSKSTDDSKNLLAHYLANMSNTYH